MTETPFAWLMRQMLAERGLSVPEAIEKLRESGAPEDMVEWFVGAMQGFHGAGSEPSDN